MMNGHINEDIFSYDIKDFKFHSGINFIKERVTETLDFTECIGRINNIKLQEM